ncbi:CLUMA_CG010177, isoform A [Clunio marinus]|uniref:CLUMA_CG010177, isoform A n=1 Tax=Clunio marinus TaxID=568069 RepID=A0A1J1I9T8_9DIPT|nr:CLUMA_CG010177, isoform A [Clunio marinus]
MTDRRNKYSASTFMQINEASRVHATVLVHVMLLICCSVHYKLSFSFSLHTKPEAHNNNALGYKQRFQNKAQVVVRSCW